MTPRAIVGESREKGLHLIAICDHNSAENAGAVRAAARNSGVTVLGGIEICTREEVHVLGIFEDDNSLRSMQEVVYGHLTGANDAETFGEQLVMNERDEVVGHNEKLLIGASGLSLEEAVSAIHSGGGIAIASHVDRPSYSVVSQLGFVPPDLGLDGVELCSGSRPDVPAHLAVIRSSDAHRPGEIDSRSTRFFMEAPTVPEIRMALHRENGRMVMDAPEET
jgi:hypothetical protein